MTDSESRAFFSSFWSKQIFFAFSLSSSSPIRWRKKKKKPSFIKTFASGKNIHKKSEAEALFSQDDKKNNRNCFPLIILFSRNVPEARLIPMTGWNCASRSINETSVGCRGGKFDWESLPDSKFTFLEGKFVWSKPATCHRPQTDDDSRKKTSPTHWRHFRKLLPS